MGWRTDARSQTATSKLGLIEPFMGKSTVTRRPPRKCWMMPFSTGGLDQQRAGNRICRTGRNCLTTGDGTKKPKGFLAYESTDEPIRSGRSANFSILYPATRLGDRRRHYQTDLHAAKGTPHCAKFMMNNNSLFAIRLLKDTGVTICGVRGWNWGSRPLWRVRYR